MRSTREKSSFIDMIKYLHEEKNKTKSVNHKKFTLRIEIKWKTFTCAIHLVSRTHKKWPWMLLDRVFRCEQYDRSLDANMNERKMDARHWIVPSHVECFRNFFLLMLNVVLQIGICVGFTFVQSYSFTNSWTQTPISIVGTDVDFLSSSQMYSQIHWEPLW